MDKDRAESILDEIVSETKDLDGYFDRSEALSKIAQALAPTDIEKAISLAKDIENDADKSEALSKIAQALAPTDREKSDELFDEAISVAKSVEFDYRRSTALTQTAQALAPTDREKAEGIIDEAVSAAKDIDNTLYNKYLTLFQIVQIIVDSRLNSDRIRSIIGMIKNAYESYNIASYSLGVPNRVWIHIVKQLMNYPDIVYLICSLICIRNIEHSKDIVNLMTEHTI